MVTGRGHYFGDHPLEPFLPPPKKILRRGTAELATAMQKGEVELSLPQYELAAWMGWGEREPPCDQKGEISKEAGVKKYTLEVDTRNSHQCRSTCERLFSNHGEEKVGKDCCIRKDLSSTPKKRKRNEKFPKFSDIIGHNHVKLRLEEVLLPLMLPSDIADNILTGIRANPTSILMYGPPGCGKTELAKALAGEAEAAFLPVGPSDILSKFVGESEASIRSIFKKAIQEANCMNSKCAILFFDEIDALGQARGGNGTASMAQGGNEGCSRRILAELLIQLNRVTSVESGSTDQCHDSDGKHCKRCGNHREDHPSTPDTNSCVLNKRVRVIVVGATNRPEDCDPALIRRFSIRLVVGLPSKHDRRRIVERLLKGIENDISNDQFDDLSTLTNGWSGADLEHLAREAVMAPVRECIRNAALQKQRLVGCPEQTGDCPDLFLGTAEAHLCDYPSWARQENMLQHFRKLREVTYQDFLDAIHFWIDNQNPSSPQRACGRKSPTSVVLTDCGSDRDN